MTTVPTWTHDPTDEAYTLVRGDMHCRVWQTRLGTWAASFRHHGIATAAYNFSTAEDAKAWCEAQVGGQRRGH